ncbi:MAG TPA: threonine synthase [Nitrospinota bacterium]|nr:threonine synthase [Nitrospinota bacterium]|tara:strand:- start:256175 stop:257404 length:1230 start_codon:yes stop_codon:yes gene_type:complete
MSFTLGLKCRECGREYPAEPVHVCEFCFGPLEVKYNYDEIKLALTRDVIESRPANMWRYRELIPIDSEPTVGLHNGFTPLVRAKNLGKELGLNNLYIKNDSVCHPTLSFKDRVVAAAVNKAREFGYDTVACASTGNLANSVAAHAASAGMKSYVFIPHDLELTKVLGTSVYGTKLIGINGSYDDVNRFCSEVAAVFNWAFVNINIRPYYGDGSKTFGYEIAEQLGWAAPDNVIVPVAGSSLITKIHKAFKEFEGLGIIDKANSKIFAAQATGCSPVTTAIKAGMEDFKPVKPKTIAKSIAIGNPADGYYGIKVVGQTNGWGEDVNDQEIVDGIMLLAETEGIFTETAGGVCVGVTKKLCEQGRIKKDEVTVISITGQGLKTTEAVEDHLNSPVVIEPKLSIFKEIEKDL